MIPEWSANTYAPSIKKFKRAPPPPNSSAGNNIKKGEKDEPTRHAAVCLPDDPKYRWGFAMTSGVGCRCGRFSGHFRPELASRETFNCLRSREAAANHVRCERTDTTRELRRPSPGPAGHDAGSGGSPRSTGLEGGSFHAGTHTTVPRTVTAPISVKQTVPSEWSV